VPGSYTDDFQVTTNTTGAVIAGFPSLWFSDISWSHSLQTSGGIGAWTQNWTTSGGIYVGATIAHLRCIRFGITNSTPFAWTNVQLFVAGTLTTNAGYMGATRPTWVPAGYTIAAQSAYIPAGGELVAAWFPMSPDEATQLLKTSSVAWADNVLPYVTSGLYAPPSLYIPESEILKSGGAEISQGYLPYASYITTSAKAAYRVIFSALTDYANHAPAR
jgi:hypothetical protein